MMLKKAKWLVFIVTAVLLSGCITISKEVYKRGLHWDTVSSPGYIDASARIEAECFFTPEYTELWHRWGNSELNISNYKSAACDRIVEDMIRSRIFSRANLGGAGGDDFIIKIDYTESQIEANIVLSVIDPMTRKVYTTYNAAVRIEGVGYNKVSSGISRALSDLRSQMLGDYNAGKGIKALLAEGGRQMPSSIPRQTQKRRYDADESLSLPADEKLPPFRNDIYAVIIGVDYKDRDDIPNLQYASQDAKKVYRLLTDPRYGGVPKENAVLLLNEKATRNEMISALRKIKNWDGYIYVYYSGHGAPKTKGDKFIDAFLVPHDVVITDPEAMEDTAIKVSYIQELVETTQAKGVMVALDACFSGGGKSIVPKGGKPLVGMIVSPEIIKTKGAGKVIITSSATNQQSWEDETEIKGGIFTHYLLEGLKGKASKDAWVKADDIADYIKDNVPKASRKLKGQEQQPQVTGSADFAVTRNWERAKVMDIEIARNKLKSAFEKGDITAEQLSKAMDELKTKNRSKTLDAFLEGKIDEKKFGELY